LSERDWAMGQLVSDNSALACFEEAAVAYP